MSDVLLQWDPTTLMGDLVIENEDLEVDDGPRTAMLLSLFCNAPAKPGDILPDGSIAQGGEGGWWADGVPVVENDKFGCRLWLLARCKETAENRARADAYTREGLQWTLDDKFASSINVNVSFITPRRGLNVAVQVVKPDGTSTSYEFQRTWAAEETA